METGTLKELNVQPGDVVEAISRNSILFTEGKNYVIGVDDDICDETGARRNIDIYAHIFRIISRATPQPDLTAITTPFGLLDAATQEALRAHGGPYEWFGTLGWQREFNDPAAWTNAITYRVKPEPKVEVMTLDLWMTECGLLGDEYDSEDRPVRVTFNRIDGVIDLASYRIEAR